jgi:hypothetical protein
VSECHCDVVLSSQSNPLPYVFACQCPTSMLNLITRLHAYSDSLVVSSPYHAGKARAHHAPVVGLCFGETPSGHTRLFSIGDDRRLVEYDLQGSTPAAGEGKAVCIPLPSSCACTSSSTYVMGFLQPQLEHAVPLATL